MQHVQLLGVDLIVVAGFARILKRALVDVPRLGCINVHPSLLPHYRGPEPFYWVLANLEKTTGVTIHHVDEGIDTGDIILQRELEIRPNETETMLIEAAKLVPRHNPQLAFVHERELRRGDRNQATLAVARKLVAYLMAVDKSGKPFQMRASGEEAA